MTSEPSSHAFQSSPDDEPAKVVGADDHDFLAAVDSHALRPFLFRTAHDLAEPGFGLLQLPLPRSHAP